MLGVCALGAGAVEGCGSQACLWGGEGIPPSLNGWAGSIGIVARLTLGDSMRNNDLAPSFGMFIPSCASWVRPKPGLTRGHVLREAGRRMPSSALRACGDPLPRAGLEERTSLSSMAPVAFLVGGGQSRLWARGSEHL